MGLCSGCVPVGRGHIRMLQRPEHPLSHRGEERRGEAGPSQLTAAAHGLDTRTHTHAHTHAHTQTHLHTHKHMHSLPLTHDNLFCFRNPDADSRPWCYVYKGTQIAWEFCTLPTCATGRTHTHTHTHTHTRSCCKSSKHNYSVN